MRPLPACTSPAAGVRGPNAASLPRFWRITFADLVEIWGEEQAEHMLAAMQRALERQDPEVGWIYAYPDIEELE